MHAFHSHLNKVVNKTRNDFRQFEGINWLNPYIADKFQQKRDEIINKIGDSILFKHTKPFWKNISPGCQLCGEGKWSCLFITGRCNANCFYCPTAQDSDDLPSTQGLIFPTPESYAEYINYFGFKGVSFSGGEPLLVKNKVLEYLKEVRKTCDPAIYTWMYTNGILVNEDIVHQLANQGLNEIRFDIGATAYRLDALKKATGIIDNITIEIPCIPEEKKKIIELIPKMIEAGVTNLNLHQLRLTPHNAPKLLQKAYTYIPAERPIVLESELAALEIIDWAQKNSCDIGINYCSFFFKNRFQQAGYRRILANKLKKSHEKVTQQGYIRVKKGTEISYDRISLAEDIEIKNSTKLNLKHKTYGIKRNQAFYNRLVESQKDVMIAELLVKEPDQIPEGELLFNIYRYEYIEHGLREY